MTTEKVNNTLKGAATIWQLLFSLGSTIVVVTVFVLSIRGDVNAAKKGEISATQITNWVTETYRSLTNSQRNSLTNYINQNNLLRVSRLIINSRLKLWTRSQMEARGWFAYPGIN